MAKSNLKTLNNNGLTQLSISSIFSKNSFSYNTYMYIYYMLLSQHLPFNMEINNILYENKNDLKKYYWYSLFFKKQNDNKIEYTMIIKFYQINNINTYVYDVFIKHFKKSFFYKNDFFLKKKNINFFINFFFMSNKIFLLKLYKNDKINYFNNVFFKSNGFFFNYLIFLFCNKIFLNIKKNYFNKLNKTFYKYNMLFNKYFYPNSYNFLKQKKMFFLYIYLKNSWLTYRHLYSFPKTNRTRTNRHSSKKNSLFFKNFVIKYIYKKFFKRFKVKDKFLMLYAEFFNKLWFFQWKSEWDRTHEFFQDFLEISWNKKRKKYKFGLMFVEKRIPLTYIYKKQKINKKKKIVPKNIYNLGYHFKFTKYMKRYILQSKSLKSVYK